MPKRNLLNELDSKTWLKFQKSWFIHNPPPRKKGVLVHPAKFPETMAQEFIEFFTKPGETVLDPMAGTGSTLVAALRARRNSYGIELNPKYAEIARQIIAEERAVLGEQVEGLMSEVVTGNASDACTFELPFFDYVLTSPPYWDMLHARGAGTQKKRRSASDLDVFYSDDPHDLGNLHDYEEFLSQLTAIYTGLKPLLRARAYLTIIVKNVKKGGKIYPLAWDLGRELGKVYTLKDEKIWCLPPGQKVWTQSGLKPIEQVEAGEKVLTHFGTLESATQKMQRHVSGQLIKIKPALLGKPIILTPEHEVFTLHRQMYYHRNGKPFHENFRRTKKRHMAWKPAAELENGDVVAFPIPKTSIDLLTLNVMEIMPEVSDWLQDDDWYYTRGRGKQGRGKLPKFIKVNNEFMRLAGWYLSEGSATPSGVHIANCSVQGKEEISRLLHIVFDARTSIERKGVWCRSRSISTFLANLFGKGSHNKAIPDFMLHLPLGKQKQLLESLWAGDGHACENRLAYKTVSEDLALGISYLTLRLGAVPSIQRNEKWLNLNYRGRSMIIMQDLLGIKNEKEGAKRDQHWILNDMIWLPIREIGRIEYDGPVYNLEVENANSYVTEGFVVHNCQDNQSLAPYGLGSAWVSNTFHHYCLQFRNE